MIIRIQTLCALFGSLKVINKTSEITNASTNTALNMNCNIFSLLPGLLAIGVTDSSNSFVIANPLTIPMKSPPV